MRPSSRQPDRPVLITEAPVNADDEFNRRRLKYLVMMVLRALCIIGAGTTFSISGWLAAAFIAAAAVLPWCAVLIANNSPAKQQVRFRRFAGVGSNRHKELPTPVAGAGTAETPPAEPRIIDL